mgnify:CR=1 FL=1
MQSDPTTLPQDNRRGSPSQHRGSSDRASSVAGTDENVRPDRPPGCPCSTKARTSSDLRQQQCSEQTSQPDRKLFSDEREDCHLNCNRHRPPPALSPLAVGHLRSATRRLLQCQPPAGPSAHSLVQFLVARHAQTAQPNAATKTATSWPICAFASAIPGAETRRTAQPTTATKATSLFSRQN